MVIKDTIWYAPAAEPRGLHIYLPDNYDSTDERYPVTYFWDGHNLFYDSDATFGKSWGLSEFLDGWDKDMIIVGLECSHEGDHRLDEYCPYDANLLGKKIRGEGDETLDWVTRSLKPFIDRKFRTYSSREATAIAGSSWAGSCPSTLSPNTIMSSPKRPVSPLPSSWSCSLSWMTFITATSIPTPASTSPGEKRKAEPIRTPVTASSLPIQTGRWRNF